MKNFYNVEKLNGVCVDDHLTHDEAFSRAREFASAGQSVNIRRFEIKKDKEIDCGVYATL